MPDLVHTTMTVDAILTWDDGTDTRYELVDGIPRAMASPNETHSVIVAGLVRLIGNHLEGRPPCRVGTDAGIRLPHRLDRFYQADLAVTCAPIQPDRPSFETPVLIVEVLSPSTAAWDRDVKLPDYREIRSVQEGLLISTTTRRAELWRRVVDGWHGSDVIGQGTVHLTSLDLALRLSEIYRDVLLPGD